MKRKLFTSLFAGLLLLGMGIAATSCSNDNYLDEHAIRQMILEEIRKNNQDLEFTQWKIVNITVKKENWVWNEKSAQWEAFADLPELTEFIYEKGAQFGYIFLGAKGKDEVQKLLPYVNTYSAGNDANGNPIYFTETISCDYQLGKPSSVAFFIKDSQLAKDSDAPQNYNFRIVLVW